MADSILVSFVTSVRDTTFFFYVKGVEKLTSAFDVLYCVLVAASIEGSIYNTHAVIVIIVVFIITVTLAHRQAARE